MKRLLTPGEGALPSLGPSLCAVHPWYTFLLIRLHYGTFVLMAEEENDQYSYVAPFSVKINYTHVTIYNRHQQVPGKKHDL